MSPSALPRLLGAWLLVSLLSCLPATALAQCVSLTTSGAAATQSFDTLSNVAGSTTNNLTIAGWFMTETGGGARDNEQYAVDTGASNTGDTYSLGAAGATERALGSLRSGTLISTFGACYTNNTGAVITSLAIAYTGEQWRLGTAGRADSLSFEYSTNATDLATGTWTGVTALNFTAPVTAGTLGALNGNAAANRTARSSTISSLSIASGATFWIRWNDVDASGADDTLAIDDFSLTPQAAAPVNLSINDVTLNEGNSGTTSFNFTVSLSAPAGAGGVSFNIATANGTATAPGDYTARSLTAQTIPAGSSTYSFTVLVNGDTAVETNETFFVNVSSVSGATVTDGQGQGTIVNDDAAPNLTINNVSLNEGDSDTTAFDFTVSLSAPAPAGGVTFDIATADGTALAPSDYTARALTAQTIPAGSSSYTFSVLVNGDTAPEADETFFVNLSNVSGANLADAQATGTIVNEDVAPNLSIDDVTREEGDAGNTTFSFTVSLSAPAPTGGTRFDIATEDGTAAAPGDYASRTLTSQTILAGSSSYTFDVQVNGDATPEADEVFFVNVTNANNAVVTGGRGTGRILNDDVTRIHDVQGNGAATPMPSVMVIVEGVVVGNFQASLQGFFLQEEDADADADPNTSEGLFVYCTSCPRAVAEGQRVRVSGTVNEIAGRTSISAPNLADVVVTDAGNHLAQVTPASIDLPVAGDIDAYYEAREGMRVRFVDTLTVSDYFELGRYGQIVLMEGGRPRTFTEFSAPSVAGYAAYQDSLARRRVLLDDDDNGEQSFLGAAEGLQAVYHPSANGGFSVGSQGTDYFRGGDVVNGLTCVLDFSSPGGSAAAGWRLRPAAATPATFTVANPRPATPPVVGGAIKVAGANLLNYFTTIDTTPSNSSGSCGPGGTLDCRGADSVAELNRQRERIAVMACLLNADVLALMEMENTASATVTDLLGAVNTRCGGAQPYTFVNTGGSLGTDAIRVQLIYRTGVVSPVGSPLVDLDPVHNRPPTAQTFDVVSAANPAFGRRFTVVANHLRAKSCSGASGGDADSGDGQSCFNATRVAQATRLSNWINSSVVPASGDPDVLLLGDFNAYAQEDPIAVLASAGYADLETLFQGPAAYSYVFGGATGHLDYALASASLAGQVTGAASWHINADEVPLLDYNDEVADTGEAAFEEKPDGSALVPPRVVFQPASPYRAADHDPVLVGLFAISDIAATLSDTPDPVNAGENLTYTIGVSNNGPDDAEAAMWNLNLPAGLGFVSLPAVAGWSCTTPAVGSGGTISCTAASFATGSSQSFSLTAATAADIAAGTVLSATLTASSANGDAQPGNNSATATTTVITSADVGVGISAAPATAVGGQALTYTLTVANAGPSSATSLTLTQAIPAGTSFASLSAPAGWSCTTPAVGAGGNISCSLASLSMTSAVFTLVVNVDAGATAATISATATVSAATTDPNAGNQSAMVTTPLSAEADLGVSSSATPATVVAGENLSYAFSVSNAGPSNAAGASLTAPLPASTSFVSLAAPGGWSCTTPAVGGTGTVTCTNPSATPGSVNFSLVVRVDPATLAKSIAGTVSVAGTTADPVTGNDADTVSTPVATAADLLLLNSASTPSAINGQPITYTLSVGNNGPSVASGVNLVNDIPANTSFTALSAPAGWNCTTPAVGGSGTVNCSIASLASGTAVFSLTVTVDANAPVTMIVDTATVSAVTADPVPGNESATATTSTPVSLQSFEVD